jgi:LysM repeat protein
MMSRHFSKLSFIVGLLGLLPLTGLAQVNSVNVQLANLQSDVNRLDQIVRSLRLEVESMKRENREVQEWVKSQLAGSSKDSISSEQLNAVLRQFEQKIQSANQVGRQTLVNEVSKEIETLAEQTQKAINALAKAVEGQPQLEQVITFNDNYPRSGTSYSVKGGDSLGKIARELGSKVDWIRNANRLSSDIIYPGQELFIPLKND